MEKEVGVRAVPGEQRKSNPDPAVPSLRRIETLGAVLFTLPLVPKNYSLPLRIAAIRRGLRRPCITATIRSA